MHCCILDLQVFILGQPCDTEGKKVCFQGKECAVCKGGQDKSDGSPKSHTSSVGFI